MRAFFFMSLVTLSLAIAGCGGPTQVAVPNLPQAMPVDPPGGSYLLTANTFAGDALHKMLLLRMGADGGILTTSFVNLHNFEQTSDFGRLTSQQIGSRLGQYGFRVIEARLASSLSMAPHTGEFMLTRERARLLEDTYDAGAVMVGNYSDEGSNVFVSVRIVRLSDSAILGAYEYYLPRDRDVRNLLALGSGGGGRSWNGNRTPAFGPGRGADWMNYSSTKQAPASGGGRPIPPATRNTGTGAKGAAPVGKEAGNAVPRYVEPNAASSAPDKNVAPAAPVAPSTSKVTPIPLEKGGEAASTSPGGA